MENKGEKFELRRLEKIIFREYSIHHEGLIFLKATFLNSLNNKITGSIRVTIQ